ncbi:unnamed protein product [Rotaria socialis]
MSVAHQPKGRGRPKRQVPETRSLSDDSSSSTIRKATPTADNVPMLSASANKRGRGRGTHLRQQFKAPDPLWKVSELTTEQFNSNVRLVHHSLINKTILATKQKFW